MVVNLVGTLMSQWETQLRKGLVELAVLATIARGETYGYRIVEQLHGQGGLQFTESTVQTDLVGPIDFKTLMQTGRTEHFTDEGLLGAVLTVLCVPANPR